jgi:hypothetical protein
MKRYRLDEMRESESGAWVRYDDHMKEAMAAKLSADVDETEKRLTAMGDNWRACVRMQKERAEKAERELDAIHCSFSPVLSWYQAQGGEQSPRTFGAMIADAVADLIKHRNDALKLKAAEDAAAQQKRNAEHIGKCNEELSRENERLKKQSEADVKWAAHWDRQLAVLREMCGGTSLGNPGDDAIVVGAWIKKHNEASQPALNAAQQYGLAFPQEAIDRLQAEQRQEAAKKVDKCRNELAVAEMALDAVDGKNQATEGAA